MKQTLLRVEDNPWATDQDVEKILMLRGGYISAVGWIETTLTELAIRASKHPAYAGTRASFPSRRPDRLKYLRKIASLEGPLKRRENILLQTVDKFERLLGMRDLMAHGRMQILSGPGTNASINLEDYAACGDAINYRNEPIDLYRLEKFTLKACQFSRCVQNLYIKISHEFPELRPGN